MIDKLYENAFAVDMQLFSTRLTKESLDRSTFESLIDFAQSGLDPDVWVQDGKGVYSLVPGVEEKIIGFIKKYPGGDLLSLTDNVHVVGSITTNQYLEDSDLDVHIFLKDISKWNEDIVWEVKGWFDRNAKLSSALVGEHTIEIYIQLRPSVDYLSPGFYDLTNHKWIKGPKIVAEDYDPYADFSDIADDLRSSVKDTDLIIGELKRDVIDFETIQKAVGKMSPENKKKFLTKLESKLEDIESSIRTLLKHKDQWVANRRLVDEPTSPEQALKDVDLAKQWRDSNAVFKLIGRYKYVTLIKDLKKLLQDDGKVTPDEIDKVKDIIGTK